MKSKYARMPVYSSFVKHLDFISVDPYSLESLSDARLRCQQLLAAGKKLLIFPEGSRATSGKLLPFKDFAFRIARDMDIPVIPVAVHSDAPFMAKIKGSHFPRRTFTYHVRFLEPMESRANETPSDFAERIRKLLAQELNSLDRGTIWNGDSERSMQRG
jgi:1-acyl-sn-glycerol-3-phosphate acyltransferase